MSRTLGSISDELVNSAPLPRYLSDNYHWAYLHPRNIRWLDRTWIVNAILWGNAQRLIDQALVEISPGLQVLQMGSVYGDFSAQLLRRVGANGSLDIIDVAAVQVANCRRKLGGAGNLRVIEADATSYKGEGYDLALLFFLLHELPARQRKLALNNAIANLKPGGRLVVIDYHRPLAMHPLRPVMHLIFRLLEPFAREMSREKLPELLEGSGLQVLSATQCFGGLYQKLVVHRH